MSRLISKCRSPSAHKRAQTQKTAIIENDRLNAAVVKINMELWDTDSDNENDTTYNTTDFRSEGDSSNPDIS